MIKSVRKSVLSALAFGALALAAQAQLTFTVNEFTTDKLVVTINPGTLLTTDGSNDSALLSLVEAGGINNSTWINYDVSGTGGGAFGTAFQNDALADDHQTGDWVTFLWNTGLDTAGDLVTGITYTFEGVGAFNPANVTNWALYWGDPVGYSTLQSAGSAETGGGSSPIPEPSSFAALAGLAVLGLAATRRRHQRA